MVNSILNHILMQTKIISLIDFFEEASNETIEDFANQELLNVNVDWLKEK